MFSNIFLTQNTFLTDFELLWLKWTKIMRNFIKSKKYTGVYYREKQDGDITYYFTYRDMSKTVCKKVGTKTEGVTERYTFDKRNETIIELRNGKVPQIMRNTKKHEIKFKEIAEFYFENRKVRSIERRRKLYKHILDFRNQFVDKLKPHTINLYVELIPTIYNYYRRNHDIKLTNPTHNVDKLQVSNTRILTKDEIETLFIVLQDDFILSLFCSLSLCTGARKSTVLNYRVKDLNLEHRTLNSYDFKNETTHTSFIDDRTYNLLQHRLNTFRHTLLSHLGMKGVNTQLLQKISNHKDKKMVDRYVKLNEDIGKKEINNV